MRIKHIMMLQGRIAPAKIFEARLVPPGPLKDALEVAASGTLVAGLTTPGSQEDSGELQKVLMKLKLNWQNFNIKSITKRWFFAPAKTEIWKKITIFGRIIQSKTSYLDSRLGLTSNSPISRTEINI